MIMEYPEHDCNSKKYLHANEPIPTVYHIFLIEPMVFRFNLEDPRNNFWFISNRFTKTLNHSPLTHDTGDDDYLFFIAIITLNVKVACAIIFYLNVN